MTLPLIVPVVLVVLFDSQPAWIIQSLQLLQSEEVTFVLTDDNVMITPDVRVVRSLCVTTPIVSVVSVIGMSPIDVTPTGGVYHFDATA